MTPHALAPRLALAALLIALPGCKKEPELAVEVADAGATPAAGGAQAGAIPPGAEMPPGHPPIDGAGGAPAPIAGHETGTPALPPGHPPLDGGDPTARAIAGTVMPGGDGDRAIAWTPPASWVAETPSSPMRRAQYRIPGQAGAAECVVFYFGPGQGGDPQANAQRWAAQFTRPDGSPASDALEMRNEDVGGMKVTFVETRGTYQAGTMSAGSSEPKPGYALLGAIVEGPDANWFFKLTGPAATVDAQRAPFESMIGSMRRGAPAAG